MKGYVVPIFLIFLFCSFYEAYAQVESAVPIDVAVVIDDSRSMGENDPEFLTGKVVSGVLNYLSTDSRVALVLFAENSELAMPLTSVSAEGIDGKVEKILDDITSADTGIIATVTIKKGDTLWDLAIKYYGDPFKWPVIMEMNNIPNSGRGIRVGTVIHIPGKGARKRVSVLTTEEYTNIPAAVERAIYELKQNGREDVKKLLILITDGIIDIGDSAREVEKYRWLNDELALESRGAGIRIFGIAFTDQSDFELIQTLAQKTHGNYYRVFKTEDIQAAINGINETMSKAIPTTEPQPQATEVSTEKGREIPLTLVASVAGLAVLIIAAVVIVFLMRRKRPGADRGTAIPEACLMDMDGTTDKKTYMINKGVITIGRVEGDNVDICIDQNTISAAHAQIRYRDHDFYLIDMGSRNGTYLNEGEEQITDEIRLKGGDVIAFDQYKFKFLVRGQGERGRTQMSQVERGKAQKQRAPSETPINPGQRDGAQVSSGQKGGTQISSGQRGSTQISSGQRDDTNSNSSQRTSDIISMKKPRKIASDEKISIPEAYIVDVGGATDEKMYQIKRNVITIGRTENGDTDVCISKNTVSGAHAQIEYRDHNFYLTDLGSRNGTYLNEGRERITSEIRLKNDDVIYFDQYRFRFVVRG